jgi:hypothetical protein
MKEYYSFISELNLDITFVLDPLTAKIVDFLNAFEISGLSVLLFFNTILFLFLSLNFHHGVNLFKAFFIAIGIGLGIYAIDSSTLTLLVIAPCLQIYFSNKLLLAANLNKKFHLTIFSTLLLLHGLLLAGPLSLFCLMLVYLAQNEDPNFDRKTVFQVVLFLMALFITIFPNYETIFLDYPIDALLTEISPLTHFGTSSFGPERKPFPIPYKYFLAQKYHLTIIFLITLSPVVLSTLHNMLIVKTKLKSLQKLFMVSFFLLTISILIEEKSSLTLFDSALIKSFPGLLWRPFPNLIGKLLANLGFITTGVIFCAYSNDNKIDQLYAINYSKIPNDMSSFEKTTPSNYVLNYFKNPQSNILIKNHSTLTKDSNLNKENCSINSNIPLNIEFLIDKNEKTKWSTKRNQKIGDYIKVTCKNTLTSSRIKLNISNFKTDFPRGFEITFDDNESTKISYPHWIGPIKYTNNGLAYFGSQAEITIDFSEQKTFNNLKITLIDGDKIFDWSIGEIENYF